ncbi:RNA polymerase sigma factor, partial [Zavarzinella formosa]|uniref:RNA polymerase sigma factor n=1 Tax=Zavarzinella formosa TaxID=360055 RepID=UPI00187D74A2
MTDLMGNLRRALQRDGPRDGELLDRFIERRDDEALAALIRRHGPMVWGVCRRFLDHHDAEDAFQATFIVLARKASTVKPRALVANWLYGVARQTALHARRTVTRRQAREVSVEQVPEPEALRPGQEADLRTVLDAELSRLPDIYRSVIVLCDLDGRTRRDAARELGVPEGTV